MIASFFGNQRTFNNASISSLFLTVFPSAFRKPCSQYIALWMWVVAKAYWLPVYTLSFLSFPSTNALSKTMSSALWAEVPIGSASAQMFSVNNTTAIPAHFWPSWTKLLLPVDQVSSASDNGVSLKFDECGPGFQYSCAEKRGGGPSPGPARV